MAINTLGDLLAHEVKDIYSAEQQIIKALPQMAAGANHSGLKKAFEEHLVMTRGQVERLETIFAEMDEKPTGKKCKGMEGLIEEGKELLKEKADPDVLDAGLIGAAQKVEHYEISGYGTARTLAGQIGRPEIALLLNKSLAEEEVTDNLLTQIARELMSQSRELVSAGREGAGAPVRRRK